MPEMYIGYICPSCKSTIDVAAVGMDNNVLPCPSCKTPMIPNENGKTVATNVFCSKCKSAFGMINSDRCPKCGELFSE